MSSAAKRKSQPTSTVCAIVELFQNLALCDVGEVDEFEAGPVTYNLQQLCDLQSVTYNTENETADNICLNYIKKTLVDVYDESSMSAVYDQEAIGLKELPSYVYSSRQRPDVTISCYNFIILLIEVHSCSSKASFQNTIRKAIMGLMDIIRHYRLYGEISVSEWTGFAFPKCKKKECVVQVKVTYDPFLYKFTYKLSKIPIGSVPALVLDTFNQNLSVHKRIRSRDYKICHSGYYFKLSIAELRTFKQTLGLKEVIQLKSANSILVKGDEKCYKFPLLTNDCSSMSLLAPHLEKIPGVTINLTAERVHVNCFSYNFVPFGTLDRKQIKPCLGDFVCKLAQ